MNIQYQNKFVSIWLNYFFPYTSRSPKPFSFKLTPEVYPQIKCLVNSIKRTITPWRPCTFIQLNNIQLKQTLILNRHQDLISSTIRSIPSSLAIPVRRILVKTDLSNGWFRQHNFCLQLLYAMFGLSTSCIIPKWYTTLLIRGC